MKTLRIYDCQFGEPKEYEGSFLELPEIEERDFASPTMTFTVKMSEEEHANLWNWLMSFEFTRMMEELYGTG
jgi:hypothetical protein